MKSRGLIITVIVMLLATVCLSGFAYAGDWNGIRDNGKIIVTILLFGGAIGAVIAKDTPQAYELGTTNSYPVKGSTIIYEGAAIGEDGSGYARALVANDPFLGFAETKADNSSGSDGAIRVRSRVAGNIELSIGSLAITDIKEDVYASNSGTFTLTPGSNTRIGTVYRYVSSGVGVVTFSVDETQSIGTSDITDDAVTTVKIVDDAITTAKIIDDAVTNAKLADDAVDTAEIADDAVETAQIAALAVDTAEIAADAVDGTKIADDAVSLEHLDAAITPSHIVVYAGEHTTGGGAAAEAITVSGVVASDLVLVTLLTKGSTPRIIVTAVATTDTVTVTFDSDPSSDHVVTYEVLRAVA